MNTLFEAAILLQDLSLYCILDVVTVVVLIWSAEVHRDCEGLRLMYFIWAKLDSMEMQLPTWALFRDGECN